MLSVLEHCYVLWGSAAKVYLDRQEKVQHRFFAWLAHYTHMPSVTQSRRYPELLRTFDVTSPEQRRLQKDILLAKKVIVGKLDSAALLECLSIRVPAGKVRPIVEG